MTILPTRLALLLLLTLFATPPLAPAQVPSAAPTPQLPTYASLDDLYAQPPSAPIEAILALAYAPDSTISEAAATDQPFGKTIMTPFSDFLPWVEYTLEGSVETLHFIHYNKWTRDYVGRSVPREILHVNALADTAAFMPAGTPLSYRQLVSLFRYAEQWSDDRYPRRDQSPCWRAFELYQLCDNLDCPQAEGHPKPTAGQALHCHTITARASIPSGTPEEVDAGAIQFTAYGIGIGSAGVYP